MNKRTRNSIQKPYDLFKRISQRVFYGGDKYNTHKHKTIFAETEITELKQKYNLDSFILEEVKEDD